MSVVRGEKFVMRDDGLRIAQRLEHDDGGGKLVQPQVQDRIVKLARAPERPVVRAELDERVGIFWRRLLRPADRDGDDALLTLDVGVDRRIADSVSGDLAR